MPASLIRLVSECLNNYNWKHIMDEESSQIIGFTCSSTATIAVRILILEAQEEIIFTVAFERRCPVKCRGKVVEMCNETNWSLSFGFFQLDFDNGELKYRHSVNVEFVDITSKFIQNSLQVTIKTVESNYVRFQQAMCPKKCPTASQIADDS
jgi:hypothetical protein